jgi:predicted dehydrogenase
VRIEGTEGSIVVPNFWHGTEAFLQVNGMAEEKFTGESGYHFEAAEVMRCVRAGKLESESLPLDETLAIMRTVDEIRNQINLSYPME